MMKKTIEDFLISVPWAQVQRIKFIERYLLWHRYISSANLVDVFGITRQRAHSDIMKYKALAPNNVNAYDASDRSYKASINFMPHFIQTDLESIISTAKSHQSEGSVFVPRLERQLLDGLIPVLLSAIDQGASIEANYASGTFPLGTVRTLHPVCIVFTMKRPHLRAYCRRNKEYRDYLLSRFMSLPKHVEPELIPDDVDYIENVTIKLIVNPQLSDGHFKLISREYGIFSSKEITLKRFAISYFLRDNNIPVTAEEKAEAALNPWSYPIIQLESETFNES
ncbi:WYL domain-containing protein [Marinomonas sp. TI.3.20]|uniref:WYL domain-containing protein n=1 Tax=Marinomonas sp. TI.3.20 TaxID=3121296 RepID=UPI00311D41E1